MKALFQHEVNLIVLIFNAVFQINFVYLKTYNLGYTNRTCRQKNKIKIEVTRIHERASVFCLVQILDADLGRWLQVDTAVDNRSSMFVMKKILKAPIWQVNGKFTLEGLTTKSKKLRFKACKSEGKKLTFCPSKLVLSYRNRVTIDHCRSMISALTNQEGRRKKLWKKHLLIICTKWNTPQRGNALKLIRDLTFAAI